MMRSIDDTPQATDPLLLMVDYDGTLTPIIAHYQQAQIAPEGIELLRTLSQRSGIQLAIVSGRSVTQLLGFLKPLAGEPIFMVGLHGGEVYDLATQRYLSDPPESYKTAVSKLKSYLIAQKTHELRGIELEDKGYSLGVHYRLAGPEAEEKALASLRNGLEHLEMSVEFILRPGKKLMEAVPKGFNKGVGVKVLIPLATERLGQIPQMMYIGDDVTDLDAMRVVNAYAGQTIFVGERLPEGAPPVSQLLPSIDAVYPFLRNLL